MIRGAKTIQEYKILKWIEETFEENSVTVNFLENGHAQIFDKDNGAMEVAYKDNQIIEVHSDVAEKGELPFI